MSELMILDQHARMIGEKLFQLQQQDEIELDQVAWISRSVQRLEWLADNPQIPKDVMDQVIHIHQLAEETIHKKKVLLKEADDNSSIGLDMFPEGLSEEMKPIFLKLMDIIFSLDALVMKPFITHRDVGRLQNRLHLAEKLFLAVKEEEQQPLEGEASLSELLSELYDEIHRLVGELPDEPFQEPEFDYELAPLVAKLTDIIDQLKDLEAKPRKWVTTKDVGKVQVKLLDIDSQYQDARFTKSGKIPHGQAAIVELLEKAHRMVHDLAEQAHDRPEMQMDETLLPTAKKLTRIIERLSALKSKKDLTTKDIGYYQNRLSSIDDKYKESRISIHHEIPKGQAVISELLETAHSQIRELYAMLESFE